MALVVEDGSGTNPLAESYTSVVFCDTYFTNRGSPSDWVNAATPMKEAALRYATQYLDQTFNWVSSLKSKTQPLGWPRTSFYTLEGRYIAGDQVPLKVQEATAEMALQWLKSDFTGTDTEGVKSESIGSASITYSRPTKSYSFIKLSLKDYGTPNKTSNVTVYRA